jgi:hypothetical protein
MRKLYLFLCFFFLIVSVFSQNIYKYPFKISALKGSLELKYDTISSTKGKLGLYYKNDSLSLESIDSAFTNEFSQREFLSSVNTCSANLIKSLKQQKLADSSRIETALPVLITQLVSEWYKKIKDGIKPQKEEFLSFKPEIKLELSDSLTADIIPRCTLRIYKEVENQVIKKGGLEPESTSLILTKVSIQISDGFIYAFNFEIDPSSLTGDRKIIQQHQAFSRRYNLRHILLARGMLNNAPPLILKREGTWYFSKKDDISSGYMFYIKDLIDYIAPTSGNSSIFTAKDTIVTFSLCSTNKKDTLRIPEKSLYSILNLDVFGDLVGFFDQANPNGLIQSELKAHFYGFRRPMGQINPFRSRFTFFNKGEVFFRFSKIDNKNRFLDVLKDSVPRPNLPDTLVRYVHGYRLLEYQNINAGLRFNFFDLENRGGSISIPVELSFLRSPLRDTLFIQQVKDNNRVDTILSPVSFGKNSMMVIPGINFKIYAASFLDIDLRGRLFFIIPLTRKINMSSAEYDDFYGTNSYVPVKTTKLINLGAHVTVNLNTDKTRRLIIRGENYIDIKQRGNNFWQAQVGYSADLNKFINLSNGKK